MRAHKSGEHTSDSSQEGTEFWPPLFGYRLKVTDTLLVAFTALVFGATLFLYFATRDLVEGAEKTAERQLRAYVHVVKAWTTPEAKLHFPAPIWATVEIQNSGQTPAYKVRQWCAVAGVDGKTPDKSNELKRGGKQGSVGILAPGGKTIFYIPTSGPLSIGEYAKLKDGTTILFVYGEVHYEDAFTVNRTTRFKLFLRDKGVSLGALSQWSDGNEAT